MLKGLERMCAAFFAESFSARPLTPVEFHYSPQNDDCLSTVPLYIILRLLDEVITSDRLFPFRVENSILFSGCA
jgi:hypothetical protein